MTIDFIGKRLGVRGAPYKLVVVVVYSWWWRHSLAHFTCPLAPLLACRSSPCLMWAGLPDNGPSSWLNGPSQQMMMSQSDRQRLWHSKELIEFIYLVLFIILLIVVVVVVVSLLSADYWLLYVLFMGVCLWCVCVCVRWCVCSCVHIETHSHNSVVKHVR